MAGVEYPKPTVGEIIALSEVMRAEWQEYHDRVRAHRTGRFHLRVGAEKDTRNLQHETRIFSNTTNREIIDTVAIQTANDPKVRINPTGSTRKAVDRAVKQERASNQFMPAFERQAKRSIRRRFVDNQHSGGLGVYEVYLRRSKAYEDLAKLKVEPVYDVDTGMEDAERTAKALLAAQDESLVGAQLPIGIRSPDPLACYWEEDDDGLCRVLILENKPKRTVFGERVERERKKGEILEGTPGWPTWSDMEGVRETCQTIRYYDRRWMAYVVEEKEEYIEEHGLPGVPIFYAEGIVTGSPNRSEMWQGVTWGIDDLERYFDDLLTQSADDAKRYRPTAVIETPPGGSRMVDAGDPEQKPAVLHPDPENVIQLNPGQKPSDLWSGVRPADLSPMISLVQAIMSRSSLNPVATGTSIGADPAGYTINTLINASQKRYEILLDNEARCWGQVVDFVRLLIRDTIKQKVYFAVPMQDPLKGGTEWLALGPEDVDETPAVVAIDAIGDQNRIATRQSLMQAMGLRVISKDRVQREGFGIDDPPVENFQMAKEDMELQMVPFSFQEALRIVYGQRTPIGQGAEAAMGGGPESGTPYQAQGDGAGGGQPAPMEAPTVGTATSALAGQGNGVGAMAGVTQ